MCGLEAKTGLSDSQGTRCAHEEACAHASSQRASEFLIRFGYPNRVKRSVGKVVAGSVWYGMGSLLERRLHDFHRYNIHGRLYRFVQVPGYECSDLSHKRMIVNIRFLHGKDDRNAPGIRPRHFHDRPYGDSIGFQKIDEQRIATGRRCQVDAESEPRSVATPASGRRNSFSPGISSTC